MIDLTNKNVEEVNILINKYAKILEVSNIKTIIDAQLLVVIIDEGIKYINDNHDKLNADLKTWCMLVLKHKIDKIKTDIDVKKIIDSFIVYWNNEYQNYCNNLAMSASDFDRDYLFFLNFFKK